ncbi:MmcQ/YjbR family DNA-binding protein [Devosia sp.]|uniref:MmcQ/YjbR family DNA-binding protein n=1 Tax=Devosia sp. TaxID=1871048 RepID=UPI003A94B2F8
MTGSDLSTRTGFEALVTSLPAVTLVEQWGSLVAKVGGKVFALIGETSFAITFKVTSIGFDGLTAIPGVGQAPYFAKGQWVQTQPGALDDETLAAYVTASHAMIAAKLTRKLRAELGL